MGKIAPGPHLVKGIDVSNWQPEVDFHRVKNAGFEFAFLKATEGGTFRDKSFEKHVANARAARVLTGAYHFFRFGVSAELQASNLLTTVAGVGGVDLPLVLDLEWADGRRKLSEADCQLALDFLAILERELVELPIIYTANGFFGGAPKPERFQKYPLWVANYKTKAPSVPAPWANWKFWQFADDGAVPGAGNIDVNYFNGTLAQLQSWASFGEYQEPRLNITKEGVEAFQRAANGLGITPPLKEDGVPGTKTKAAAEFIAAHI